MAKFFADSSDSRSRIEPLRADLKPYLEKTRAGYFIRHPFANEMVVDMRRCAELHQMIDERTAQADACFESQDWEGYINCIEVHSQPEWFAKDAHLLSDAKYWTLLGDVYRRQKHTCRYRDLFRDLFRSNRPGRDNLMSPEEQDVLTRLPEEVTVYRGYSDDDGEGYAEGIAWTLDRRAAVWHANRYRKSEEPRLIKGMVPKANVWAYFDGGDLLLPPEAVVGKHDRFAWNEKARQAWHGFIRTPFDVSKLFVR